MRDDIEYYESNLSGILAEQSLRMVIVLLRQLESEKGTETIKK